MNDPREERRLITILFADLSGFTSFSKDLDPEEIREAINVCFEHLNRVITRHDGTIHKYEGDLVIALFGIPHAHEDDPERAIRSALEMMRELPEINRVLTSRTRTKCDFGLHVGINTGLVFAGEIGSDQKKEYTVIGEAVNVASRLKDAAKRGEILVTERVFRQTRYLFDYQAQPAAQLKGIDEPIKLFMPLGIKEIPELKRGIEGLSSPLVGRQEDLAALEGRVRGLAGESKGGAVFILGEAGIGKSRLTAELKNLIAKEQLPVTVLEGACLSYGAALAYFPFTRILMQLFGIMDQDEPDAIRDKIGRAIDRILPDAGLEIMSDLCVLLAAGTEQENEKVKYLDAKSRKVQIWFALKNLFTALARQRPLLMIIEDYHWIDTASLEFLEFMLDLPRPFPFLAVMLSRVEKESAGFKIKENLKQRLKDHYLEVSLSPLDPEASRQLVDNILSVSGISAEAKSHILAKAEGNPFYLEEVLRSLIDQGLIVRDNGMWRAVPGISVRNIPDTVHGVIAARMDRLAPELKGLLQKASVIGRNFDVPVLEGLADMDAMMMSLELATLEECEFIMRPSGTGPEPGTEYAFKHPLVQEVAYNSLPRRYRSDLHQLVAEVMERVYPHIHEEYPEILAYHYASSDNVGQALEWLKRAGQKAMARYANEEAIQQFERIVSLTAGSSDRPEVQTAALAGAYEALGDLYALTGVYNQAITQFEALKDTAREPIRQATALRKTAGVYFKQSKYAAALEILAQAERSIAGDGPEAVYEKAEIGQARSAIYTTEGRLNESRQEAESALAILDPIGHDIRSDAIRAQCLNNLGTIYRQQGEIGRAIEVLQQSIGILEQRGLKGLMGKTMNQLAVLYTVKADYDRAIELNGQALKIMEEIGDKMMIGGIYGNLGVIYAHRGDTERALECHKKHSAIAEAIGDKRSMGVAFNNLGRIYGGQREHYDQALASFQRAQGIFEEIGDQMSACAALGNMAIIHLEQNEPEQAEHELLRTEQILTAIGNKEMLVNTYNYLTLVQLAKKTAIEEARRYAGQALAMAEAIDSKAGRADAYVNYAQISARTGDIGKAREYFDKGAEIYHAIGRRALLGNEYRKFAQTLKDHGQVELAAYYFSEAKKIGTPT